MSSKTITIRYKSNYIIMTIRNSKKTNKSNKSIRKTRKSKKTRKTRNKYPTLLQQMKDNPWMEDILHLCTFKTPN